MVERLSAIAVVDLCLPSVLPNTLETSLLSFYGE